MKDLQFRLRELGTTGGSDSEESIFAEPLGVRQWRTKAVYEKSPIKPEKFRGNDFNRWKLWISLEFLRKRYFDLGSEQLRLR